MTNITQLIDYVDENFVTRRAARNREEADRWTNDDLARMREYYLCRQLPKEVYPLLDAAMTEWQDKEKFIIKKYFEGSTINFETWFERIRSAVVNREPLLEFQTYMFTYRPLSNLASFAEGRVGNISWCETFGVFLPQAAAERQVEVARVGSRMTAFFYLEKIGRLREEKLFVGSSNNEDYIVKLDGLNGLNKIDACWVRAREFCYLDRATDESESKERDNA